MFKNPFSFKGRIRRTEYGISYLIYIAISVIQELITFQYNDELFSTILLILIWVPLIWFYLAQGAKRCHDRDNSGWYQIIPFYVFWMIFADSDFGPNEYGENPKGLGNYDDIDDIGKSLKIES